MVGFGLGSGENAGGLLLAAAGGGGWAAFPQFSPVWFNDLAGMAHF